MGKSKAYSANIQGPLNGGQRDLAAQHVAPGNVDCLRAAGIPAERLQSGPATPGTLEEAKRISAGVSLELVDEARTTALSTDAETGQANR